MMVDSRYASAQPTECEYLERASNIVVQFLWKERDNIDLIYKLKFDPNQPDKVTISGLAIDDYSSLKDIEIPEFASEPMRPIPREVMDQLNHAHCIYTVGILSEIGRAYMTVDSELYMWNFEENCDLAYFDGIPNTIIKVGLAKPTAGLFQGHVRYLLVVVTSKEILLLAITLTNSVDGSVCLNDFFDPRKVEINIIPDAVFKIPLEGATISDIVTTKTGRIFYCEEEYLMEIDYQKIIKLCVDDSRFILYALTEKGSIQVYDLGHEGTAMQRVCSLSCDQIQERASVECQTVDPSFFTDVVSIGPILASQSHQLHVVAITRKGVRLYFSCHDCISRAAYGATVSGASPPLPTVDQRPVSLRLRHLRLPPGYGLTSFTSQPFVTYDAYYDHELALVISECVGDDSSMAWAFSAANFSTNSFLAESLTHFRLRGTVLAVASLVNPLETQRRKSFVIKNTDIIPTTIVTQHDEAPKKLAVLTEKGVTILHQKTPVDFLREILRRHGSDSSQAFCFFQLHGPVNICAMTLIILCAFDANDSSLKEPALKLFFSMGSEPQIKQDDRLYKFSSNHARSLDATHDFGSPLQSSTPQRINQPIQVNDDRNLPYPTVKMSSRHQALYLYFSRLVGSLWNSPFCCKSTDGKLACILSSQELDSLLSKLKTYRCILEDNNLIGSVNEFVHPFLVYGQSSRTVGATTTPTNDLKSPVQIERRSLISFQELLSLSIEAIALWRLVCLHQFHVIASQLSEYCRNQLLNMHFSVLIVAGHKISADLITCLIRHYLVDNARTASVCAELRSACPTLFSDDDALSTKATEMIEEARNMEVCTERTELLSEAINLLIPSISKINLPIISQLLYEAKYMEGIVDLALARADRDDPKGLALFAYKSRFSDGNHLTKEAFSKRMDAYKCITDALDRLMSSVKIRMDEKLAIIDRDLVIQSVLHSKDELANMTMFKWLLDNGLSTVLIQSKSPFLESFLHYRVEEGGSNKYLDLLWRFHERNEDFEKAAKLLYNLSQRPTDSFDLRRRISYLSQAVLCAQSSQSHGKMSDVAAHDFIQEMRDKLDVAQIQLAIKSAIATYRTGHIAKQALQKIDERLYTVQELFEEFAVPFNLPQIKLALCFCSGTYDEEAIEGFCSDTVDSEFQLCNSDTAELLAEQLGSRLAAISRQYIAAPKYFPFDVVMSKVLTICIREKYAAAFVDSVAHLIAVPMNQLIDFYVSKYRRDPFWQNNESAFQLLANSSLCALNRFLSSAHTYPLDQRKSLASKCLDLIAMFLLQLESSKSLAETRECYLIDNFKTLQRVLERTL